MARKKLPGERRSDLVHAALKVFEQKGYSETRISAIVKEAGVAQGTFYIYFKSKEDVLDAVSEHLLHHIVEVAESAAASDQTAVEKVQEIIRAWLEFTTSPGPLIEELHDPRHAILHDQLAHKGIEKLMPPLTEIVKQGVSEGSMNALYPEVTAANWVSSRFPMESMPTTGSLNYVQMVEAYADFVSRLLGLKDRKMVDALVAEARSKKRRR